MKTLDNEKSFRVCCNLTIWEKYALGLQMSLKILTNSKKTHKRQALNPNVLNNLFLPRS